MPETVLRTTGLPFGPGRCSASSPFDAEQHYFTLVEDAARHDALRTICAFDLVANSADRKGGHCLAGDDGAVYAIDNGLTFHEELKLRTVIWDFGGEPVPEALLDDVTRLVDEAARSPGRGELVSRAECAALLRRAGALLGRAGSPWTTPAAASPGPWSRAGAAGEQGAVGALISCRLAGAGSVSRCSPAVEPLGELLRRHRRAQ